MENRSFKVRLNSTFSDSFSQDTGVPQGSILSTTLFGLKINSVVKCLSSNTDSSLYVDDFLACYRARQMRTIERQVQLSLNKLQTWADQNGFKFSSTKTVCIHFYNKHKVHPDPHLTLYENVIPVVKETKFLGVLYDSKLTFLPHLKQLKTKCMKAMNLMKVVAHRDWGADRDTLLKLYHCMIRSKVDYGCIVYDSARKSYKQIIDPVQNTALRLCLGSFRTSPAASLQVECNELPLQIRRDKLCLQFALKLSANSNNPAFDVTFLSNYQNKFDCKPTYPAPFGIRVKRLLNKAGISLLQIAEQQLVTVPPWLLWQPPVTLKSHGCLESPSAIMLKLQFFEMLDEFSDFVHIYTDGSKEREK